MNPYTSIEWRDDILILLDQRVLPQQMAYIEYRDYREVAIAIREMVIRGAPAIGAAAAYGMALAAIHSGAVDVMELKTELGAAADILRAARPTAVNLAWAIDRVMGVINDSKVLSPEKLAHLVLAEGRAIADEEVWTNQQIGFHALAVLPEKKVTFIHHCNTGSLATVDYGTALGVVRAAHEDGREVFVFVDETRPRLQGARLTAWELQQLGIPHKVIVDGASGHIMKTYGVDFFPSGCDRIAANGDTANKIGTYNLAIVARAHKVPMFVVGPTSTIDLAIPSGDQIEIEERPSQEITHIRGAAITPDGTDVANPAFDVTPAEYIAGFITEAGIAYPPFSESLPQIVAKGKELRQKLRENR